MARNSGFQTGKRPKGKGKNKNSRAPEQLAYPDSVPQQPEPQGMLLAPVSGWPTLQSLFKTSKKPLVLRTFSWRAEAAAIFLVFTFALTLYGITTPQEVALEDDGLFLMILHHFGVGHPPGYPLYALLGGPFYHLLPDFLSPAYKGHMFSGFMGAIACVAIYVIVTMLVRSRLCALAAGLAYAASEAFWSQAIIAEVYTLNAAVFFIVLAMCLRYASHAGPANKKHMILYLMIAFTYGLGLSNHWPLMGLGSVGLLMIVLSQTGTIVRRAPLGLLFLTLGLLPYVWLYLRSYMETPVKFYGEIEPERLWFYISRGGYSGVDSQAGVGWEEKLAFTQFFIVELSKQLTPLGLAFAGAGFVAMLRSVHHCWLAISLAVAWVMAGPLLIALLDFQTEFIWFSAFRVYHLLCYGITAIWFAYGLAWAGDWIRHRWSSFNAGPQLTIMITTVAVIALGLTWHWEQNNRRDYTWARDLAMFKLINVEPNAKLFTFDDLDLPVGYLNIVEGVRSDVEVYNDQALVFEARIYTPFTPDKSKSRIISNFARQTDPLPIYYHTNRQDLFTVPSYGSDLLGFWRRLNRTGPHDRVVLSDELRYWIENNLEVTNQINDRWTKQQASGVIATLISALHIARKNGHTFEPEWEQMFDKSYAKNELVHFFLLWHATFSEEIDFERAQTEIVWIDNIFATKDDQVFDNTNWADLLMIKAQLNAFYPDLNEETAEVVFERTLLQALDFDFKYEIFKTLADYYRGQSRQEDALVMLNKQHPVISKAPLEFRELHDLLMREKQQGRLLGPIIKLADMAKA